MAKKKVEAVEKTRYNDEELLEFKILEMIAEMLQACIVKGHFPILLS